MEIDNPHLKEKRRIIVELDKAITNRDKELVAKLNKEYDETEYKSREFTQSIIDEHSANIEHNPQRMKELRKEYPSVGKQIKAIIELHRYSKEQCKIVKDFKMKLYEEQKANRLQKQMETS